MTKIAPNGAGTITPPIESSEQKPLARQQTAPEAGTVAWFDAVIAQNQQIVNNLRAEIEEKTIIMQQTIGMINGFAALREQIQQKEAANNGGNRHTD